MLCHRFTDFIRTVDDTYRSWTIRTTLREWRAYRISLQTRNHECASFDYILTQGRQISRCPKTGLHENRKSPENKIPQILTDFQNYFTTRLLSQLLSKVTSHPAFFTSNVQVFLFKKAGIDPEERTPRRGAFAGHNKHVVTEVILFQLSLLRHWHFTR